MTIPAGGYYLVRLNNPTSIGQALPTPDFIAPTPITLADSGVVALVKDNTILVGCTLGNPNTTIVDLLAYGEGGFFCKETQQIGKLSVVYAAVRKGCDDFDNNLSDFKLDNPQPKNSNPSFRSLCPYVYGLGTNAITIPNPNYTNSGLYKVIISGACSPSVISNEVLLSFAPTTPIINTQPIAKSLCNGSGIDSMKVSVNGFGLTYQWRKDGANIQNNAVYSGATTATLTFTNPTTAYAGVYSVAVKGTCSSV
ncbi:MAG: hypothetical protein EBX50_21725, partial [Chitinophagia bacterium]|nr:hypothetical protein [Chitinophagia bacterium]